MPETLPVTPSQTVGPFFHDAMPYPAGPRVAAGDDTITLTGVVLAGDGTPIPDALLEIWQAGPDGSFATGSGIYAEPDGFRGFGRCPTDESGRYAFTTLKPGAVPTVDGEPQAPHIAMSVFARGMLRRVVTRVYFADEAAANAADPLLRSLADDRRATLIAKQDGRTYHFDVVVQGNDETVFLDVFAR